jgi:hypothetical protein
MTVNLGNIIIGEAQMYYAPYGLATPGQPEPVPSDFLPYGTPWGGNYVAIGATNEGVGLGYDPTNVKYYAEESPTPAVVTIDTSDVTIAVTLVEDVLSNLLLAAGVGSIATQAASGTGIGKSTFTFGYVLNPYTVGFEAANAQGSTTASAGRSTTSTGSTTISTTTLTDTGGAFSVLDVGRPITATGVPVGTYIAAFLTSTTVTMSAPATATGSTLSVVYGALPSVPYFRRVYIPKMLSGQKASAIAYRRAKAPRMYDVELQTVCLISQIQAWDQTAVAT